ncbi:MAG: hypothetical protein GXY38_06760 [Planctomycetes bacterium]|jgi:hypothetical protein|nr:hypothetical protein [Planctomycetota bacterium]
MKTELNTTGHTGIRVLLAMNLAVLALLALVLAGQLFSDPLMAQQGGGSGGAIDGFGGTATRVAQLLEQQQQMNQKLDQLINLFATGQAKVQIVVDSGSGASNVKKP